MTTHISGELVRTVEAAAARLRGLEEAAAAARVRPDAWSIKEIVGHLIDSAANNHHRFVRAPQHVELAFPAYEQDSWVRLQDYQTRPWLELIELWVAYNRHLSHVIRHIPAEALDVTCRIGSYEPVTLRFLVDDYLVHMRHHLQQIEERALLV